MKLRKLFASENAKTVVPMAPMIDVVFQLLIFFILTLKIAVVEGDFNVKMPLAAASASALEEETPFPLLLKLRASENGELAEATLNDRSFGVDFAGLRRYIHELVGENSASDPARNAYEIEFDCDYELRYEHVIQAVTHVTGERRGGDVVKLIEKIRFSPPKRQPST